MCAQYKRRRQVLYLYSVTRLCRHNRKSTFSDDFCANNDFLQRPKIRFIRPRFKPRLLQITNVRHHYVRVLLFFWSFFLEETLHICKTHKFGYFLNIDRHKERKSLWNYFNRKPTFLRRFDCNQWTFYCSPSKNLLQSWDKKITRKDRKTAKCFYLSLYSV